MNPNRAYELQKVQFAFVQGGNGGFRLVHVTPPISMQHFGPLCEAIWSPAKMPLTYATAPIVIDNEGRSDVPLLAELVRNVRRPTPVSKFASAFRSNRHRLAGEVGAEILKVYAKFRKDGEIAKSYEQALPYPPPKIEIDRIARYRKVKRKHVSRC